MTIGSAGLGEAVLRAANRSRSSVRRLTLWSLVAVDLTLIVVAVVIAVAGRNHLAVFSIVDRVDEAAKVVGIYVAAAWLVLIALAGGYRFGDAGAGAAEYQRIFIASGATAGLIGIGCYLTKFDLSRGFFVLMFLIGTPLLIMGRFAHSRVTRKLRQRGHLRTQLLLCGAPRYVDEIGAVLRRESWLGHTVVGAVVPPGLSLTETPSGVPVVGRTDDVVGAVEAHGADAVLFAEGSFPSAADFRRMAWDLEEHNVQMIVVPSLTDVSRERITVRPLAGLPLVYVGSPQSQEAGRWLKRAFDIVGSTVLLILTAPIMLFVGLWVRLHDGGSPLYRQVRVGRDGTQFGCLKFRSMVTDAGALLPQLQDANDHEGPLFKLRSDPRITTPGRIIRRFSLDELPQLVNVLKGDMSLVGPRPPLPDEVERYEPDMLRRLRVRPGMTGLWQVSGRSDLSWQETMRLDLYYVDNWSIIQDISILARTFSAVLSGRGAY